MNSKKNEKQRVVAYTRVSTKSEAQLHSFEYQNEYYKNKIEQNPNYEFCGIYADHGISGRSIKKRSQFLQMIKDCNDGKIDIIYTKSVARFSRNTEELLDICANLREKEVRVIFEKENIDTYDSTSKLLLAIAAGVAEYDLKIISENQKWSARKRFAKGYISIGNHILGYKLDKKTNSLQVIEKEAETVKLIYKLYLSGYGKQKIAFKLKELGIEPTAKAEYWNTNSIDYILRNERYTGNSLQQKTVSDNGVCKLNIGLAKQYYIVNSHEAIISQEDYDKVQKMLKERAEANPKKIPMGHYDFSSKITCGECGSGYVHKFNNTNKPYRSEIWVCPRQNKLGNKVCNCTRIKDDVLKEKFVKCYNNFVENGYQGNVLDSLNAKMKELLDYEQELISLRVTHMIQVADYNKEVAKIREEVNETRKKIEKEKAINITKADYVKIEEYDKSKVDKFLESVTITKNCIKFTFYNGAWSMIPYTNGKAGNKKGWLDKKKQNGGK